MQSVPAELVWRNVVIGSDMAARRRLILEINDGSNVHAFDGFGLEIKCHVLRPMDQGRYQRTDQIVLVHRLYRHQKDFALYDNRAESYTNLIVRDKTHNYFMNFLPPAKATLTRAYVHTSATSYGASRIVLFSNGAAIELEESAATRDNVGRCLQGAIFGEVRACIKLTRQDHFGNISYVRESSDDYVAVKIVNKVAMLRPHCENPREEIVAMQNIHRVNTEAAVVNSIHKKLLKHVSTLIHCAQEPQDNGNIFLVMPFYNGGELLDTVPRLRDIHDIGRVFVQLVRGLKAMQFAKYNHRDLSLENVLLHNQPPNPAQQPQIDVPTCVIIDFGMSCLVHEDPITNLPRVEGRRVCGKHMYYPPEFFLDSSVQTRGYPADIWAVGLMLYIMILADAPFDANGDGWRENFLVFQRRVEGHLLHRNPHSEFDVMITLNASQPQIKSRLCDHMVYNLLVGMLRIEEEQRWTLDDIIGHPWVAQYWNERNAAESAE